MELNVCTYCGLFGEKDKSCPNCSDPIETIQLERVEIKFKLLYDWLQFAENGSTIGSVYIYDKDDEKNGFVLTIHNYDYASDTIVEVMAPGIGKEACVYFHYGYEDDPIKVIKQAFIEGIIKCYRIPNWAYLWMEIKGKDGLLSNFC